MSLKPQSQTLQCHWNRRVRLCCVIGTTKSSSTELLTPCTKLGSAVSLTFQSQTNSGLRTFLNLYTNKCFTHKSGVHTSLSHEKNGVDNSVRTLQKKMFWLCVSDSAVSLTLLNSMVSMTLQSMTQWRHQHLEFLHMQISTLNAKILRHTVW